MAQRARGLMGASTGALSLFSKDTGHEAVAFDHKAIKVITIVGIPSAFLLHGYVGFIFGSVKANPWWSSVLMPIVFLLSAIVSGIAMVMLLYMVLSLLRAGRSTWAAWTRRLVPACTPIIVDFSLEGLDFIHRVYQSEESIKILGELVQVKLFTSLVILQVAAGHARASDPAVDRRAASG